MKLLLIPLFLTFVTTIASAQESQQSSGSFTGTVQRTVESTYLIYLPDGYDEKSEMEWPLLVFLHGSGERGSDLQKVKVHGPPKLIEAGKKFPFVVLSPQCPDSTDWDTETLFALIRYIASEYQIDESRVYLTGLSMGGWATWDLVMAHPDYFAAIAPVCGRINRNYPLRAGEIKSLPVWVFHGAADDVVLINQVSKMIIALKAAGNEARFTIYPLSNHDSWTETYDNPELYEWFLKQKKN
ncbi:MAG: prolyl oligopeptidase family serine peptidase [Bacteroidales bacterium]|nr:prolyl oligopeptidase family serine peptidase [Bacteroidales bacterium]